MESSRFDKWCKSVIINKSRNYHRDRGRHLSKISNISVTEEGWVDSYFVSNVMVMGMEIEVRDGELLSSIMNLNHVRKTIIMLYYFAGFTDEETGRLLGIPLTTVNYNRNKALKELREEMMKNGRTENC